jgi:spore coat polysaccharide biosynthesis protein SpsF
MIAPRPTVRAFVQARMSSRRFPGKVLAPFRGRPLIDHVLEALAFALPHTPVLVTTSDQSSDDPLVAYLVSRGVTCYRGALDDVLGRFAGGLRQHPADHLLRICADSPLLSAPMLRKVLAALDEPAGAAADLITTTHRRTFERGNNAELIRAASLLALPAGELQADDREHVTAFFHRHPERYRVVNVESDDPSLATRSVAVDTLEDLRRLETLV